jgi:hypothetical protein
MINFFIQRFKLQVGNRSLEIIVDVLTQGWDDFVSIVEPTIIVPLDGGTAEACEI